MNDRMVQQLLLSQLRRKPTVAGQDLADYIGLSRLRTVGEAAKALRLKGVPVIYVPAKGYRLARSRQERLDCADRMRKAGLAQLRAAAALRRGRSRQTTAAALRVRRAGGGR